ncbi:MAG: response regulator [Candidatus Scalindua sp.]|nr:response regulator [Candidatus Scalindua sp.]
MKNGKILVMDDSADIRFIFTKMLNRLGYEVEIARDGSEAILQFKNAIEVENPFDAVIMDLKIADGMGGEEAIKLLLELDPEAKIILCSGSVTDVVMIGYREYGISAVIRKPFKMVDLVNALQIVNSDSSKQVNAQ